MLSCRLFEDAINDVVNGQYNDDNCINVYNNNYFHNYVGNKDCNYVIVFVVIVDLIKCKNGKLKKNCRN